MTPRSARSSTIRVRKNEEADAHQQNEAEECGHEGDVHRLSGLLAAEGAEDETRVPLAAISRAKLVLTDELIAATQTTKRV